MAKTFPFLQSLATSIPTEPDPAPMSHTTLSCLNLSFARDTTLTSSFVIRPLEWVNSESGRPITSLWSPLNLRGDAGGVFFTNTITFRAAKDLPKIGRAHV